MVQYLNNGSNGFQQFMAAKDGDKKSGPMTIVLWVIMAMIAGWLAYTWLVPKPADVAKPGTAEVTASTEDVSRVPEKQLFSTDVSKKSNTPNYVSFSNAVVRGLRIYNIALADYKQESGGDESIQLLAGDGEFAELGFIANGTTAPAADTVWRTELLKNDVGPEIMRMSWKNSDGVEFVRSVTIKDYIINISDKITNNSGRDISITPYARMVRGGGEKSAIVAAGAVALVNNSIEREAWHAMSKKSYAFESRGGFIGFEDQYWETIAQIGGLDQTMRMKMLASGLYQADAAATVPVSIRAGQSANLETRIYAGTKTQADLKTAAAAIPGIEQTIDYGWFWFLARPFLWALNALYDFVGNYGIAIIILTIILRALMWPLTRKSYTSMAAMQKMQPEMQRIQKLYADDKPRLQAEMMRLYQTHKTNPMSGCLPMILQIPIFFALYKALLVSVPMRQAQFLWIRDLGAADPTSIFNLFGLLPYSVPGWMAIGALPIIMGLSMWWQQHLQTANKQPAKDGDAGNPMAQTQKFMKWLPFLFVLLFAWMPAGLVLYWTVSNLFGIGQMWVIKRKEKNKK